MGKRIEKWKIIKNFENYAISDHGRVLNLNTGKFLKWIENKASGYPYVTLHNEKIKHKYHSIHCLVAIAFIGDRPEGMVIHHLDENKRNPVVENLMYVTYKQNNRGNCKACGDIDCIKFNCKDGDLIEHVEKNKKEKIKTD